MEKNREQLKKAIAKNERRTGGKKCRHGKLSVMDLKRPALYGFEYPYAYCRYSLFLIFISFQLLAFSNFIITHSNSFYQ